MALMEVEGQDPASLPVKRYGCLSAYNASAEARKAICSVTKMARDLITSVSPWLGHVANGALIAPFLPLLRKAVCNLSALANVDRP